MGGALSIGCWARLGSHEVIPIDYVFRSSSQKYGFRVCVPHACGNVGVELNEHARVYSLQF